MQEIEKGDLVLLNLMVYVDGNGAESEVLELTNQLGDNVARFHEIVKPGQPEYQGLLGQWKQGTELKKQVRGMVNESVDKAQGNWGSFFREKVEVSSYFLVLKGLVFQ